ncbi:UNVERIFIED_CONTAM: tRNA:m(4)X modification enzyme TRM13, partial [Siphonaria sp. JEL0065]
MKAKKEPVPPKQGQCNFLIAAKNRYCPLQIAKDSTLTFCPNHAASTSTVLAGRTPCAYCKTSIAAKDLSKHVRKCNLKPPTTFPKYFQKDVNVGTTTEEPKSSLPHVRDLPPKDIQALISKIRKAHDMIQKRPIPYTTEVTALPTTTVSDNDSKSTIQVKALGSRLYGMGVISPDKYAFVEMGCGTAEFSYWVNEAILDKEVNVEKGTTPFILVDREPSRWKVKMERGVFEKIRIDIKDFVLKECDSLSLRSSKDEGRMGLVCISKHLCGAATDLTIRCLENYALDSPK